MPESLDPNSIMKLLKKASSFDIFLISFLALPFVFKAWLEIAEKLSLSDEGKSVVLVVVAVFYAAGMIAMYRGNSRAREREIARDQIIGYFTSKGRTVMSCERIRKKCKQHLLGRISRNASHQLSRCPQEGKAQGR